MLRFTFSLIVSFWITGAALSQHSLVGSPMLGYMDMREGCIWVQTTGEAEVYIEYRATGEKKDQRLAFKTSADHAFTHHFVLTDLEPGTRYVYTVGVNGKPVYEDLQFTTQSLWQYRTDPPELNIAIGSCAYFNEESYDRPGKPYGMNYGIFDEIARKSPDAMLWLGDNVYFREVDWSTRSGMIHRYTQARSLPQIQKLLNSCPHYAIWDDHDFGPNDSNGSFIHKDKSLDVFKLFWANPSYGLPGIGAGITSQFTIGDAEFFFLDNRYFRTDPGVVGQPRTILGREQIDWLILALRYSKAPFKFVAMGGQFLNSEAKHENYATYPEEREIMLKLIDENKINGVVFLTGDRHCTELSADTLQGGTIVYDLTASPLTSQAYDNTSETNINRVPGTIVATQNFAMLNISGKRKERKLKISVFNHEGKRQWEKEISSVN
ncbi:MAG: hypothetical protein RL220_1854 [Bacteroidota bacterium]|jgi:alkaline phosphatase D